MKHSHRIDSNGRHHVSIEDLKVWIFRDGDLWVAQGLDIDYATSGTTIEEAQRQFSSGLSQTIGEYLHRFGSIQQLLERRAPDDVYAEWTRALDRRELINEHTPFTPTSSVVSSPLPATLSFYRPQFAI